MLAVRAPRNSEELWHLIGYRLGMWIGLDHAEGPEGGATYLQVGNAWH